MKGRSSPFLIVLSCLLSSCLHILHLHLDYHSLPFHSLFTSTCFLLISSPFLYGAFSSLVSRVFSHSSHNYRLIMSVIGRNKEFHRIPYFSLDGNFLGEETGELGLFARSFRRDFFRIFLRFLSVRVRC